MQQDVDIISYFVFTAGEKGANDEDFGVKFVSSLFDQNKDELGKWETKYEQAVYKFDNLGKALKRPEQEEPGLLMLPWPDNDMILVGFIFPQIRELPKSDGKNDKRYSISLVAALIKSELHKSSTPAHVFKTLWRENKIEGIAKRTGDSGTLLRRPKCLLFNKGEENAIPFPSFFETEIFESLEWPENEAVLCIDGEKEEKKEKYIEQPQNEPSSSGKSDVERFDNDHHSGTLIKWIIGVVLVLGIAAIAMIFMWPQRDVPYSPAPAVQSEEEKSVEGKLKLIRQRQGGLNRLVEIFPADWTDLGSRLTRKDAAVWKGFGTSVLPSLEPAELLYLSQSSIPVKEDVFVADFARWFEKQAPLAVVRKKGSEITQFEIDKITLPAEEYRNNVKEKALAFAKMDEAVKAGVPSDEAIQKELTRYLEEKRGSSESFNFAFVFKETEALYKIIIDHQPRDSYAQLTERYYVEPGWILIDQTKIEHFISRHLSIPDYDESIHIKYENSFSSSEPANTQALYKMALFEEFAKQMLDYARN